MPTQKRTPADGGDRGSECFQAAKLASLGDTSTDAEKQAIRDELAAARRHLERRAQANHVMILWRDELRARLARADLCIELIGLPDGEHDALRDDVAAFTRCCRALGWYPNSRGSA